MKAQATENFNINATFLVLKSKIQSYFKIAAISMNFII